MDLPEIRAAVGLYLSKSDLAAAAQVCRSWNSSFQPALYSAVRWPSFPPMTKSWIVANADYIRHLVLLQGHFSLFANHCTNLVSLVVENTLWDAEVWNQFSRLVQCNPRIRLIDFTIHGGTAPMEFMNALSSCSDLRTLRINMHGPDATSMELVFDIAVRLEHLTIIGNCKGFPTSLSKWPCFPNLKELELKVGRNVHLTDQLEIIRRCPALVGLTWRLPDRVNYPISDICDLFRTHCRFIERLGLPFGSMSDQDLFRIVQSGCRFTRFQFPRTRVGQWAFQSMAGHFASLQELDLGDCGLLTSQMAQRIMTGCPNLISFWGVSLNARDILGISRGDGEATGQGGSESTTEEQQQQQQQQAPKWVCTQLRILSIFIFGFAGEPQDWYRRVLEQLSRLTKLETLAVGSGWSSPDGLDLRLETGLGVLSTLTELQEFRFEGLSQKMEEQDVRWMVEAWPKLRLVKGKLHQDRRQRLKMIHILTDKKVQAPFSDADNDSSDDEDSNYNDDSDNGDAASTAGDASGAVVDLYPSIAGLGSFEDPNTSEDSDVAVVLRHRHRVRI